MSTVFDSQILQQPPEFLTADELQQYQRASFCSLKEQMMFYENLIARHEAHPFILVRIATMYAMSNSPATALHYYQRARSMMLGMNIVDSVLDTAIANVAEDADQLAKVLSDTDHDLTSKRFFSAQPWKPTKNHKFPHSLPTLPEGHEGVRPEWEGLAPNGQDLFSKYLMRLVIETNQIESVFRLTEGSTQDLVRCGISEEALQFLPESSLKDPAKTKSILNDTLAAYDLLKPLISGDEHMLNPEIICRIHARLMNTDRFKSDPTGCIVAGHTRSLSRKNVFVQGRHNIIQCCPFPEVDKELGYICRMANARLQWISSWGRRNPFATASWIHLVLVRCHPFEDGNGRLSRLLASIPLMKHGYPPITITLEQSAAYYDAINKAYSDDYKPFIDCILKGMKDTLEEVKKL